MSRYRRKYSDSDDFIESVFGFAALLVIGFSYKLYRSHPILFFIVLGLIPLIIGFIIYKKIRKKKIITTNEDPFEVRNKDNSYKGNLNEYEIYEKLNELNFYKRLLKNIYIPVGENKTTEIDIIMICNKGIFVIESKNYNGWIYGSSNSKNWTLTNKYKKIYFYNPIWQNKTHVKSLSNMLEVDSSNFESIICFGPNSVLKATEKFESGIKIINVNSIGEVINNLYNIRTNIYTNEEVDALYNKLRSFKYVDESVKENHINNISE